MLTCGICGEENPDRARFCLSCGNGLGPNARLAGEPSEERKVVSVLFADLVGFTARSHSMDPEDVRAVLRPYHAVLKEEIERFGGIVEKFIGDAIMAVFGAPVAREDDAERAVRAALRVAQVVSDSDRAQPGLELAVRVGVGTGDVVVSLDTRPELGEGMVTGDVVNTAFRIQQVAPVGGVAVGEVTYRLTNDLIEYERLTPQMVKGKPDPLHLWRAIALRSRSGVQTSFERTPLVGRMHELALLRGVFASSVRDSSLRLVTITGEPGIGKTRLVYEFASWIDELPELVTWRQGSCPSYGPGIAFAPLSDIVKAHSGILESDEPEEAEGKLDVAVRAAIGDEDEHDWFRTRLAPLVGVDLVDAPASAAVVERREAFTAWRRFLEAIASNRPLVCVFEDLHWADPGTLDFIEDLVDGSIGAPIIVVCTARPELFEVHPRWGGGARNTSMIPLFPLEDRETDELISLLLADSGLPPDARALLLGRSGGNPLYAEQFVRMLRDRGSLGSEQEGISFSVADMVMPETVQALLAARLDALPTEEKLLLHDAAVIGDVFWPDLLITLSGRDEPSIEMNLRDLVKRELIGPVRDSTLEGHAEYSFRHLLAKDVAYAQLPRAERIRKHRAVAEWIEGVGDEGAGDSSELVAHHFRRALLYARASGTFSDAEQLEAPTRRALVAAGDKAMRLDPGNAQSFYQQALELLDEGDDERPQVVAKATEAAWQAGRSDPEEATRAYETAIDGMLAGEDRLCAGETMVKLARVVWERGDTQRCRTLLREAVEVLEHEAPGPELAFAYAQNAGERWASGLSRECVEWSEKTLELAVRLGIREQELPARGFRGCARCELGDYGGLDDLRKALQIGVELGVGRETAVQYNNLGYLLWLRDGPDAALDVYRDGIEFAERRGLRLEAMWLRVSWQEALYDLGRWDEVLALADEVRAWDRTQGRSQAGVIALMDTAHVLMNKGERAAAKAASDDALERARAIGESYLTVPALALAVALDARSGPSRRGELVEELRVACRVRPIEWTRHLVDVIEVLLSDNALEDARDLLKDIDGLAERRRIAVVSVRAMLAEADGELAAGALLYSESATQWRRFGASLEEARAHLGEARCLLDLKELEPAAASAAEARRLAGLLGAGPLGAEAEELAERAAALTS